MLVGLHGDELLNANEPVDTEIHHVSHARHPLISCYIC